MNIVHIGLQCPLFFQRVTSGGRGPSVRRGALVAALVAALAVLAAPRGERATRRPRRRPCRRPCRRPRRPRRAPQGAGRTGPGFVTMPDQLLSIGGGLRSMVRSFQIVMRRK